MALRIIEGLQRSARKPERGSSDTKTPYQVFSRTGQRSGWAHRVTVDWMLAVVLPLLIPYVTVTPARQDHPLWNVEGAYGAHALALGRWRSMSP